jgi:hypothetical protein
LTRRSTSFLVERSRQDVDTRAKRGHDKRRRA